MSQPTSPPLPHPHTTIPAPRPIILALSGPSSSGKTTIATCLAALLPHCSILHLDDFYLPEAQLPLRAGVPDWDSADSFDLDALRIRCERWKDGGGINGVGGKGGEGEVDRGVEGGVGGGESKEEKEEENWTGDGVHGGTMPAEGTPERERLDRAMARLKHSPLATSSNSHNNILSPPPPSPSPGPQTPSRSPPPPPPPPPYRLLILDGILLHTPAFAPFQPLFDIRILLRASFADAKRRREARGGYVTLEGFWRDPEGYFEDVVWQSYVEGHEGLFEGGDVEGVGLGVGMEEDGEEEDGEEEDGEEEDGEEEDGEEEDGEEEDEKQELDLESESEALGINENEKNKEISEVESSRSQTTTSTPKNRSRSKRKGNRKSQDPNPKTTTTTTSNSSGNGTEIYIQPLGMDLAQSLEWVWDVLGRALAVCGAERRIAERRAEHSEGRK